MRASAVQCMAPGEGKLLALAANAFGALSADGAVAASIVRDLLAMTRTRA